MKRDELSFHNLSFSKINITKLCAFLCHFSEVPTSQGISSQLAHQEHPAGHKPTGTLQLESLITIQISLSRGQEWSRPFKGISFYNLRHLHSRSLPFHSEAKAILFCAHMLLEPGICCGKTKAMGVICHKVAVDFKIISEHVP